MSEPILQAIVIHNGMAFTRNEAGYLLYDGKPLGVLKWGHPALIAALGTQYASPRLRHLPCGSRQPPLVWVKKPLSLPNYT